MMKEDYFEIKRFHLSKKHLYQNGKAENIPVATGHLVYVSKMVPYDRKWLPENRKGVMTEEEMIETREQVIRKLNMCKLEQQQHNNPTDISPHFSKYLIKLIKKSN